MNIIKISTTVFSVLSLYTTLVSGDYSCVCNYNVEKSVFTTMNEQGSPIGYMYEFDCKQKLDLQQGTQGWFEIAFEHQIGYLKQDDQIQLQLCPGDPPHEDIVTTVSSPVSSTQSAVTSSTNSYQTSKIAAPTDILSSTISTKLSTQTQTSQITTSQSVVSSFAAIFTRLSTTKQTAQTSTTGLVTHTLASSIPNTFSLGNVDLCSDKVRTFAQSHHGIVAQFENNCYVLVKDIQHWLQAEQSCNSAGGHLVHISSRMEQSYIYSFLKTHYDHSIWIGLSDIQHEAHFQWSSGQQFYFVNWANHTHFSDTFEDCVVMDMHIHGGKWDDRECTFEFYPYICQYGLAGTEVAITTQTSLQNSNITDGNTQLCLGQIKSDAAFHGAILGQYERGCYELLLNKKVSWEHGENICQSKGGHLAHISNSQQQAFVESFMQRHNPSHAVWLGLHDTITEGTFQWTAGTSAQFTNWIPGHSDNTLGGHNREDCVTFVPQRQGYWDDVSCGYEEIFGDDSGETHYAFCQYKINSVVPIVG
ncbi:C-type mannose receptor 2-like [Mercenaria mercenaria]|uniref:C-type mannose receptor 2-like n=1 Tax=Mercenaria mercenaria TaxID=6596 RepID=UPI00234EBA83|nr:C-type mannose receptor 2-like [Mercenaria mercenaria]